ncbi:hypothetical protein J6590_017462 [Homalodisca vitripennis]|nr:hypothetical protein J6590_017462 [Homalodisca vitripennis]
MLLYQHGSESILPQGIQHQVCTRVSYPRVPRVPPTPCSTPCCCIRMEVRVSYLTVYNISYTRVPRVPPTPSYTPCCCISMEVRVSYLKVYNIRLHACQLPTRTSCTAYAFLHTMLLYPHGSESILPQGIQHQVARVSATHAYLVYRLRLPPHRAAVSAWK